MSLIYQDMNLIDILSEKASNCGDQIAYSYLDSNGDIERELTFSQLHTAACETAAALQASGLKRQDRVVLFFPAGPDFMISFLGVVYAGGIPVPGFPLNPRNLRKSLPRMKSMILDCEPALIIHSGEVGSWSRWLSLMSPRLALYKWKSFKSLGRGKCSEWKNPNLDKEDILFLQYTSGSTSQPRGVMVSHSNVVANSLMIGEILTEKIRRLPYLLWAPHFHDLGLISLILPIIFGNRNYILSPMDFLKDPLLWLKSISRYKAGYTTGPTFALSLCSKRFNEADMKGVDLSCLKLTLIGTEPVRAETVETFAKTFGPYGYNGKGFVTTYGLAEFTLVATTDETFSEKKFEMVDLASLKRGRAEPVLESLAGPAETYVMIANCGLPRSGHEFSIVDPKTQRKLSDGQIGEVWLSGPSRALGYWNRPELYNEFFNAYLISDDQTKKGPFLRTGDLGYSRNGHLFVTGRIKDLIIVRGANIFPDDVEGVALKVDKRLRPGASAAFQLDECDLGKVILVQEVANNPGVPWDLVGNRIQNRVAGYFGIRLHEMVFADKGSIAKTSSGKIQRAACRAEYLEKSLKVVYRVTFQPSIAQAADVLDLEGWLKKNVAELGGGPIDEISNDRPFTEMGLDSLALVELVGGLQKILKRDISTTILWEYPTISALCQFLSDGPASTTPSTPLDSKKGSPCEVAIIGMSCRFPGANNPEEFYGNLLMGKDHISKGENTSIRNLNGLMGGYLESPEKFDAEFFNIPAFEATWMDPQQRWALELAWNALENANIIPSSLKGKRVGVYVGASYSEFSNLFCLEPSAGPKANPYASTGGAISVIAGRISYLFDFRGPCIIVDTACSSSLAAVHLACQSLRAGDCDLALVGGVNSILSSNVTAAFDKSGLMAPDGHCKAFDQSANGYVRGEGCGFVVLERMPDAIINGRSVLSAIWGSAMNQDGKSNGMTAPNIASQQDVYRGALRQAGLGADRVRYLEAHGTGTALGDAAELDSIAKVYSSEYRSSPVTIGSVKANIGHLEAAAGVAGLIKVVSSLVHSRIPKQIHYSKPNSKFRWDRFVLEVERENVPWPKTGERRFAGVSSFGFSGTNTHLIVGDAHHDAIASVVTEEVPALKVLFLSASSKLALLKVAEAYELFLNKNPEVDWGHICLASLKLRQRLKFCATIKAGNVREAIERLSERKFDVGEISDGLFELKSLPESVGQFSPEWLAQLKKWEQKFAENLKGNLSQCTIDDVKRAWLASLESWGLSLEERQNLSTYCPPQDLKALSHWLANLYRMGQTFSSDRALSLLSTRQHLPPYPWNHQSLWPPAKPQTILNRVEDQKSVFQAAHHQSEFIPWNLNIADLSRLKNAMNKYALTTMNEVLSILLKENGVKPGTRFLIQDLVVKSGLRPIYSVLIKNWLKHLETETISFSASEENQWLWREAPRVEFGPIESEFYQATQGHEPLQAYLDNCRRNLLPVLKGEKPPLETLFVSGQFEIADYLYHQMPMAKYLNSIVKSAVEKACSLNSDQFNILEIGAGTGGTTAEVVKSLDRKNLRYVFSDISDFFLMKAEERFKDLAFMEFRKLNIEEDPSSQNMTLGEFDLVIAANVLHACSDLGMTLSHVAHVLKPGGLLFIVEVTQDEPYFGISTGLIEGWQKFNDPYRDASPLISSNQWERVLNSVGFTSACSYPTSMELGIGLGAHVIVASTKSSTINEVNLRSQIANVQQESLRRNPKSPSEVGPYLIDRVANYLRKEPSEIPMDGDLTLLGFDSLMALALKNEVEIELGLKLDMRMLLGSPTISGILKAVNTEARPTSNSQCEVDQQVTANSNEVQTELPPVRDVEGYLRELLHDLVPEFRSQHYNTSLIELGLTSLAALEIQSRIEREFHCQISLSSFLQGASLNGIATEVKALLNSLDRQLAEGRPLFPPKTEFPIHDGDLSHFPLSASQRQMWFMSQLDGGDQAYYIVSAFDVEGMVNLGFLQESFRLLIKRHSILRTCFTEMEGMPVQLIDEKANINLEFEFLDDQIEWEPSGIRSKIREWAEEPIRLENAPLLRAKLYQGKDDKFTLTFVIHHIICDGRTIDLLIRDLFRIYDGLVKGQNTSTGSLNGPEFKDYISWEAREGSDLAFDKKFQFWKAELEGAMPLKFALDFPRPAVPRFKGGYRDIEFSKDDMLRIRERALELKVSVHSLLLSAFGVLLATLSERLDFVVATPFLGRPGGKWFDVCGPFVGVLPLRLRGFNWESSFGKMAQIVHSGAVEAMDHGIVPMERIISEIGTRRGELLNQFFQVYFVFYQRLGNQLESGGAKWTYQEVPLNVSKGDLGLYLHATENGLEGRLQFDTDIFVPATVEKWIDDYKQIIGSVLQDTATNLRDLLDNINLKKKSKRGGENWGVSAKIPDQSSFELCTQSGAENFLSTMSGKKGISYGETVLEMIAGSVTRWPKKIAAESEVRAITYEQLEAESNKWCQVVRERGLGRGDVVPLIASPGLDVLVVILGVLKSGAAFFPIDPRNPEKRVQTLLDQVGAKMVFIEENQGLKIKDLRKTLNQSKYISDLSNNSLTREDVAVVNETSGSMGTPKVVLNTHGSLLNLFEWMIDEFALNENDVVLNKSPLNVVGSIREYLLPLCVGAKVVFGPPNVYLDVSRLVQVILEYKVTGIHFVPSLLREFLNCDLPKEAFALRRVCCGGEAVTTDILRLYWNKLNIPLYNMYGLTESFIDSIVWKCARHPERVFLGECIHNTAVYLLNEHQNIVKEGQIGEIYISGQGVALGYLGDGPLTAKKFVPDPFSQIPGSRMYRTGDLARMNNEGKIEFIGRKDGQIKIFGNRVEIGDIEAAIMKDEGIFNVVVLPSSGFEAPAYDENFVAFVMPKQNGNVDISGIIARLDQELPRFMIPREVIVVQSMPRTLTGKVDRKRLFHDWKVNSVPIEKIPNQSGSIQSRLIDIWREILKRNQISPEDKFFDLGGHSLLLLKLHSRISSELNVKINIVDLFRYPSVDSQAKWLQQLIPETKKVQTD